MEQALLNISEVAQRLGVSKETIKNWGERGILSLTKVGRTLYVTNESLEEIEKSAQKLSGQMRAVEQLHFELESASQACMDDIKEYRLEMMMRKESTKRINLYMEIFASLTDLIYEDRYEEKEYKTIVMFLKGSTFKEIAESLEISTSTVINNIRKCNEILFNLQPYTKLLEEHRAASRKAKLLTKDKEILQTLLTSFRQEGMSGLEKLLIDDITLLMTQVNDLHLLHRTKKLLTGARIYHLGDLACSNQERLQKITGFGYTQVQEVKELLAKYQLTLDAKIPGWESLKKAYGRRESFHAEVQYEKDAETQQQIETVLEGLPEDRADEARELILGIYALGSQFKENFLKYKDINKKLRQEIIQMERCLRNEEFYLSPSYIEAKKVFERAERIYAKKEKDTPPAEEPTDKALGFLDCIFSQDAYRAESKRTARLWEESAELKKKVEKLEAQLNEKPSRKKTPKNEEPKEVSVNKDEASQQIIKELRAEIERLRKKNETNEKSIVKKEKETESLKDMKKEYEKALQKITRQELDIKQLQFEKKSRDLTIEALSRLNSGTTTLEFLKREQQKTTQLQMELIDSEQRIKELEMDKEKFVQSQQELDEFKAKLNGEWNQIEKKYQDMMNEQSRAHKEELAKMRKEHKQEVSELWGALGSYEDQVKQFEQSSWIKKIWHKLDLFSYSASKILLSNDK